MASQSIVGEKSLAFAKRTARCYRYLSTESASPKRSENNKLRWDVTRSFAAAHL